MDKFKFSTNFNNLTSKYDIKYVELSRKTGIRADKLSKFSNPENKVLPSVDDLVALSQFFKISVDQLLGLSEPESDKLETNKAFLTYNFLSKFFELNKLIPLEIEYYSEDRKISRRNHNYKPQNYVEAMETYEADLALIKMSCTPCYVCDNSLTYDEIISNFLLDWKKVKDASKSTNMPELEEIWVQKKLNEIYSSCELESMFYDD